MKKYILIFTIIIFAFNCNSDDVDYAEINGKVIRVANGDGVANQSLSISTQKKEGNGIFSHTVTIDENNNVITDSNGDFSVNLITEPDAYVTITHWGNSEYFSVTNHESFWMNETINIPAYKAIPFKITVKNTNPYDENDRISISLYTDTSDHLMSIENIGIENNEGTSWIGTNVNSIINYIVAETPVTVKVHWYMKKNGIQTSGFSENIPFQVNQNNEYLFEY